VFSSDPTKLAPNMSNTTVKTPINQDFESDQQPIPSRKGDSVSYYTNSILPANAKDQKSYRKGIPGGDWNQENDTRFAKIAKVSAETHSDKVFTAEEISNGQWQHEEKLVLDLIQPGGARTCPSDQLLEEFAKACEYLEPTVLGSILINTLRDSQVSSTFKAKAVCGIDSLIRSHNKYRKYFHANCATLIGLNVNYTVVKNMLSTVIENLQSGKPGREMLKRSQTSVISTPKPDVDLISFDENNEAEKSSKSKFSFIRAGSNVATPLQEMTPQNGSGVLDLMSLDVSMVAPTPDRSEGWKNQLEGLPSAILNLYQQQKNGRVVTTIPPLHTMHAFLWDDVQSMQGHQLGSSSGVKAGSAKVMDEREKAFDFIKI
jgi:hypothetical protein